MKTKKKIFLKNKNWQEQILKMKGFKQKLIN